MHALDRLRSLVGSDYVLLHAEAFQRYGRDRTTAWPPAPLAVALPNSTAQVAQILEICNMHGIAVVPSGGRTGLAGGAVAARSELVLSLERLNHLDLVDAIGGTIRVQAGATLGQVQRAAAAAGWFYGVDYAARNECQIGGNIATNAGGMQVIRYGMTRQQVLGLEVVLMTGQTLNLGGAMLKDNAGPDLKQWFIGSEGIFGVVTGATLRLLKPPKNSQLAWLVVPDLQAVLGLYARAARSLGLLSFEYLDQNCLDLVRKQRGLVAPIEQRGYAYVLIEAEVNGEDFQHFLREQTAHGIAVQVAQDAKEYENIWGLRGQISSSLGEAGWVHKNDISVPIGALSALVAALPTVLGDAPCFVFGHIGDGNLHINTLHQPDGNEQAFHEGCTLRDERLFALVQQRGGSVSAEHGLGLAKRHHLAPSRVKLLRQMKQLFDPKGLLNPGKVLPDSP